MLLLFSFSFFFCIILKTPSISFFLLIFSLFYDWGLGKGELEVYELRLAVVMVNKNNFYLISNSLFSL
jgi:hypothetical protein